MSTTTDPNDPRLTRGTDSEPTPQAAAYLVLSDDERAKGFVRPVRRTYVHVGVGGSEIDPDSPTGRGLKGGACGAATRMKRAIAETYARDPKFYGATYCVQCRMHLPVAEFVWEDGSVVGS